MSLALPLAVEVGLELLLSPFFLRLRSVSLMLRRTPQRASCLMSEVSNCGCENLDSLPWSTPLRPANLETLWSSTPGMCRHNIPLGYGGRMTRKLLKRYRRHGNEV
jgi:hypothetical protein